MLGARERASPQRQCPLCRDSLGAEGHACTGCGTAYHNECFFELGGCSTLGCSLRGALPDALEQRAPEPASPADAARNALGVYAQALMAGALGLILGGSAFIWMWTLEHGSLVGGVVGLLVGLAPLALVVAYQLSTQPSRAQARLTALLLAEPLGCGLAIGALATRQIHQALHHLPAALLLGAIFGGIGSLYGVPFMGALHQLLRAPRRFRATAWTLTKRALLATAGCALLVAPLALFVPAGALWTALPFLPLLGPLAAACYTHNQSGDFPFLDPGA